MQAIREALEEKYGCGAVPAGEIRPTMKAPVLLPSADGPTAELLFWGFRMPKSLVINARAETAAEKPLFRESVRSMRCVIPSSGFYEWDAEKRKYLFTLPGKAELYMAGLYAIRDDILCFCILTTAANESMRDVHDRMPLILTREQISPWLSKPEAADDVLQSIPPQLEKMPLEPQMSLW